MQEEQDSLGYLPFLGLRFFAEYIIVIQTSDDSSIESKVGPGRDYSKKARILDSSYKKGEGFLEMSCALLILGSGREFSVGFPYSAFCPL